MSDAQQPAGQASDEVTQAFTTQMARLDAMLQAGHLTEEEVGEHRKTIKDAFKKRLVEEMEGSGQTAKRDGERSAGSVLAEKERRTEAEEAAPHLREARLVRIATAHDRAKPDFNDALRRTTMRIADGCIASEEVFFFALELCQSGHVKAFEEAEATALELPKNFDMATVAIEWSTAAKNLYYRGECAHALRMINVFAACTWGGTWLRGKAAHLKYCGRPLLPCLADDLGSAFLPDVKASAAAGFDKWNRMVLNESMEVAGGAARTKGPPKRPLPPLDNLVRRPNIGRTDNGPAFVTGGAPFLPVLDNEGRQVAVADAAEAAAVTQHV